jgi:hypothetical protein
VLRAFIAMREHEMGSQKDSAMQAPSHRIEKGEKSGSYPVNPPAILRISSVPARHSPNRSGAQATPLNSRFSGPAGSPVLQQKKMTSSPQKVTASTFLASRRRINAGEERELYSRQVVI